MSSILRLVPVLHEHLYQHPKYVCFARIAGCHLRQLSTTDRGMSLVEAITQGVLRGMEALLQ